jgi:hypothetical protein
MNRSLNRCLLRSRDQRKGPGRPSPTGKRVCSRRLPAGACLRRAEPRNGSGPAAARSGNAAVSGRCWRDCNTTPDPSQNASARNPSNFGSNTHPGPLGSRRTDAAAIGATGATTGSAATDRTADGVSACPLAHGRHIKQR